MNRGVKQVQQVFKSLLVANTYLLVGLWEDEPKDFFFLCSTVFIWTGMFEIWQINIIIFQIHSKQIGRASCRERVLMPV